MFLLISELVKAAKNRGDKKFNTGLPCPRGHFADRYTCDTKCIVCTAEYRSKNRDACRKRVIRSHSKKPDYYKAKNAEWQKKNPEKVAASGKRYAEKHKELLIARRKAQYDQDPEKFREKVRINYLKNPESYRARSRAWCKANLDLVWVFRLNRRARIKAAGGKLTKEDVAAIILRQRGKCVYCSAKTKLVMDHIMPLVLGGSGHPSNFQGLCRSCNSSKSSKHPVDYAQKIGLLL